MHAAENGVVAYIGNELRGYGNLVLIRHADGWITAYAHNEVVLVSRGEIVRRGETIGRVGSTGDVATPQEQRIRSPAPSLGAGDRIRRSENATVSTSARIVGSCIIEPGAVIEDGVVIHDSVVLTGAVVQRRAVMSRSITASFAKVPAASRVIESIVVEGEGVPARGVAGASAAGLLHGLGFWPGG